MQAIDLPNAASVSGIVRTDVIAIMLPIATIMLETIEQRTFGFNTAARRK